MVPSPALAAAINSSKACFRAMSTTYGGPSVAPAWIPRRSPIRQRRIVEPALQGQGNAPPQRARTPRRLRPRAHLSLGTGRS